MLVGACRNRGPKELRAAPSRMRPLSGGLTSLRGVGPVGAEELTRRRDQAVAGNASRSFAVLAASIAPSASIETP